MEQKFCRFCGELHDRYEDTCSDECATELIRTEFVDENIERACLWCPKRGDTSAFKMVHCCNTCHLNRLSSGACNRCGGPFHTSGPIGPNGLCLHCANPSDVIRETGLRAFLLVDRDTERARLVFTSKVKSNVPHRDYVSVIRVNRAGFETVRAMQWGNPVMFIPVIAFEGDQSPAMLRMMKLFSSIPETFTSVEVLGYLNENGKSTDVSCLRYFERAKRRLRDIGVSIEAKRESLRSEYVQDKKMAQTLLLYYRTKVKNRKMGYYWR